MKHLMRTSLCVLVLAACGEKPAPQAAGNTAPAPTADKIAWDDPSKGGELDWPMSGAEAMPTVGASAFGRTGTPGQGSQAIWKRLSSYSGSFLRSWRQALEADDAPPPNDIVDAFNELAFAVTGPTGFWRKTVPGRWLGCESTPDSAPCKKVQELNKDLEQWDQIQKQIESLAPDKSAVFLARNEARILLYLDTYVPTEPSSEAMKATPFYQKNLAQVMDTMANTGTNANDL